MSSKRLTLAAIILTLTPLMGGALTAYVSPGDFLSTFGTQTLDEQQELSGNSELDQLNTNVPTPQLVQDESDDDEIQYDGNAGVPRGGNRVATGRNPAAVQQQVRTMQISSTAMMMEFFTEDEPTIEPFQPVIVPPQNIAEQPVLVAQPVSSRAPSFVPSSIQTVRPAATVASSSAQPSMIFGPESPQIVSEVLGIDVTGNSQSVSSKNPSSKSPYLTTSGEQYLVTQNEASPASNISASVTNFITLPFDGKTVLASATVEGPPQYTASTRKSLPSTGFDPAMILTISCVATCAGMSKYFKN